MMASWTRVWASSKSWWWTGRPGMLPSMGSQKVRHDWTTELNWTDGNDKMWGNARGWGVGAQRIFRVVKMCCMILYSWTHVIIYLANPTQCTTPRVNHHVNYGLCVTMMHQCRFMNGNKCTTVVGDVDSREAVYMGSEICTFLSVLLWAFNWSKIKFIYLLLEYNCVTMLCYFLLYSILTQP